uniref:C2H2-type domain-containing protein n=1 Tax=Mola mola TaxID=94237 RepID=A0A3Q3W0J0_MOLML
MADSESDLETDGLELALNTLCKRHCSDGSAPRSKSYCSEFCELVEEYTGHWQVPLPQLKVLRTALCCFTKATAAFPDDCQHVHYVLSSLALSFFELMLFFSKEEFVEKPLKDIIDSFQVRTTAFVPIQDYLSSELPIFFELRVRYLQACERMQEAKALAKGCLENCEAGKHLYFHQAYLTCLYKASLHEHLCKELAEIDGHDAVEIICNTESVEKDELLLSLCKAFLTQQLHNGDMYCIWDLVFIWSRLHLRAHPCKQGFLAECLKLASSATNVRAIFPFIKLVTTELGGEGVHVCVEVCARAFQLCDMQADMMTRSLVCKTIAFLLPHDLEICRACALLVFCQERSLEAYRTVCLLYMHPDQEPHPHNSPVRTSVRFHILQMLKERLCFDPEFWNLLTLRNHCLELMSDKVMKDAVLSEMTEEEEKEYGEELLIKNCVNYSCSQDVNSCQCTEAASDDEADLGDDPEFRYNLKSTSSCNKPVYSLRRNQINKENSASVKLPLNRKREYLSRCVKSQILKRKGLNVMRHALSHLKGGRLRCILCGVRFKQLSLAKKHILDHMNETGTQKSPVSQNQKLEKRKKAPSLKWENRIIRNLRTLIKKTSALHNKCKNPSANIFKHVDFKDEQVVIKDGLVIVKEPSVVEMEGEGEGKERPAGENGHGVDIIYHLCPSESCDRVFLKISSSLTKHAIKCHIKEDKVLEKTFVWAKHKCTLCFRQIQYFQHYKDHMKLHDSPLQPQCQFTDCEKLFPSLQSLYDHEWRHYIPAPQKDELELRLSRQMPQNSEAPWKQRVKAKDLWLQSLKEQREGPCLLEDEASNCGDFKKEEMEDQPYEGDDHLSSSHTGAAAAASNRRGRKRMPVILDPLNVRDSEDLSTLSEGVQKSLGEPHITEHKSFQPEDPSYATFVKAPFVRPPPSTYLNESVLSMRKRKSMDDNEAPPQKLRTRCDKCLLSFSSFEELQKHQALNTCSALFGFDSDDEGK